MVIRPRSSYHLHEQQIFQGRLREPETQEDCQRTELRRHFRRLNELTWGLRSGHVYKGAEIHTPVINDLNDNIIGIDFMHRNKLIYDVNTRQVKFADEKMNTICATKQITIPAMTSSIITTKFNGDTHPDKTYIVTIHCPGAPTLMGVPSLVTIDSNQNCKVVIENCTPYEVTIKRNGYH